MRGRVQVGAARARRDCRSREPKVDNPNLEGDVSRAGHSTRPCSGLLVLAGTERHLVSALQRERSIYMATLAPSRAGPSSRSACRAEHQAERLARGAGVGALESAHLARNELI